jgi:hypothetical protein
LAGSEALSNKTITASAFNGTVGATTPSTVAATTGVFSSNTSALPAGPATTVLQVGGADSTNTRVAVDSFAGVSSFVGRRANGTNASKTAVVSGNIITSFSAFGYGSTAYTSGAGGFMGFSAAENWTDTTIGTNATITVVPNGSTAQTVSFNFANTGIFSISGGATPGINSTAIGNVTPSTGAFTTLSASGSVLQDYNGGGGNAVNVRFNSSNQRGGLYVNGSSGQPFIGGNLTFSSGSTFNYDKTAAAWAIGDAPGNNALNFFWAASGTAGTSAIDASTTTQRVGFYNATGWNLSTGLAVTGQITSGNIVSTSSGGYTLGTSSNKWLTAFIQTISDGATANGALLDSSGTAVLHGKGTDWTVQRFYSSGNEKLSISSTGLAVTGNLSASSALNDFYMTSTTGTNRCNLRFINTGGTYLFGAEDSVGGGFGATAYDGAISIPSGKGFAVVISGTGVVQRTTSTGLAVTGEVRVKNGNYLRLENSAGNAFASLGFDGTNTTLNYPLAVTGALTTTGNVGIGTTSPGTRLHVNGDSTFNQGSGYVFSITGGSLSGSQQFRHWVSGTSYYIFNDANQGVYLAYGGTSWTSNSDERAKDIIEPITDAADKVSSLRAVIGKYKTDPEGTRRSFLIAQDVQAVLPEAVDSSNPENLGVQYTEVIPLLVASIKELTQRVAALESN